MEEKVIGFDLRDADHTLKNAWSPSRRDMFLLRDDVERIFSVDKDIWPSLFEEMWQEMPTKIGWVSQLWADIGQLNSFVESTKIITKSSYWTVGFTQFLEEPMILEIGLHVLPFNPDSVQNDWRLLGFDVAEQVLLSGLTNMGYRKNAKLTAMKNFAGSLNKFHLFEDVNIAQEFALWNQTRDPGHGPWFVTGIYQIQTW